MKLSMTAAAAAMLLASCGGGGGESGGAGTNATVTPRPALQLSGTAATGLALANSPVQVKCAAGSGSTTTKADGTYTLNLEGAVLPCVIEVTSTVNSTTITLHSVTEAGTASGSNTVAVANVTPLTEMVVAQATGVLPADLFSSFGATSAQRLTTSSLSAAVNSIVAALKAATGIDLGTIDPLKAPLVAATSTNTAGGNTYDKLLDTLGTKLQVEALPQVISQIAAASTSTAPATGLSDAMTAVAGGTLAGCPTALSGKYRTIDYWGRTVVRAVDFAAGTLAASSGPSYSISTDSSKPCTFVARRMVNGVLSDEFEVAMGPAGAGAYRSRSFDVGGVASPGVVGYIFPVQSHTYADVAGDWSFLQSGYFPGDNGAPGVRAHSSGGVKFAADRKAAFCENVLSGATVTCQPDSDFVATLQDRIDGGFDLTEQGFGSVAQVFAYRAPNGSTTLFATTNPTGATTTSDPTAEQSVLVATKLLPLTLPSVGTVNRYNETVLETSNGATVTRPVTADSNTTLAVNTTDGSITRRRTSDSREDTLLLNKPLPGLRTRVATQTVSGAYQVPLAGVGITVTVNSAPSTSNLHFYALSVSRP